MKQGSLKLLWSSRNVLWTVKTSGLLLCSFNNWHVSSVSSTARGPTQSTRNRSYPHNTHFHNHFNAHSYTRVTTCIHTEDAAWRRPGFYWGIIEITHDDTTYLRVVEADLWRNYGETSVENCQIRKKSAETTLRLSDRRRKEGENKLFVLASARQPGSTSQRGLWRF